MTEKRTVSLYLQEATIADMDAECVTEKRSRSEMAEALICEALDARADKRRAADQVSRP